jgi:hypothetical protein
MGPTNDQKLDDDGGGETLVIKTLIIFMK